MKVLKFFLALCCDVFFMFFHAINVKCINIVGIFLQDNSGQRTGKKQTLKIVNLHIVYYDVYILQTQPIVAVTVRMT